MKPKGHFLDKTDSNSKLRVHCAKNSMFSRRDNKRRRAVGNNDGYENETRRAMRG
jgi:hypothetical protein